MRKTVCLNMIVKNESHIIEKTLTMLTDKIKFDYWVICDTGSTDSTPTIIIDFFSGKNIPGELLHHSWKNFAVNRTLALLSAYNKTDYVFIFDADDDIVGDVCIPPENATADAYDCVFKGGVTYNRIQLVNNRIKWEYKSVIHEFISCVSKKDPIIEQLPSPKPYHFVSGRSGSRNQDPNKYLKDAIILQEAHAQAVAANDPLHLRYAFYCANSYKDHGDMENAIKWYKTTLSQNNWTQEKYVACLRLFECYRNINQIENAHHWLVESYKYETQRAECTFELVHYYCLKEMYIVAYNYYRNIQFNYEKLLFDNNLSDKLFLDVGVQWFMLPYYMIIIADRIKHLFSDAIETIRFSFKLIFSKKYLMRDMFYVNCLLSNFKIYKEKFPDLIPLYNSYIGFLRENGIILSEEIKAIIDKSNENREEYKNSKNILIYTGFSNVEWNYTYSTTNALGGSETMAAMLAKYLADSNPEYQVYVCGQVKEETLANLHFVNLDNISSLISREIFYCVIVSRYVAFYEKYSNARFYKSIIWAHDTLLLPYGGTLGVDGILNIWDSKIDKVICLTEWHKSLFIGKYPSISKKIEIVPNAIRNELFPGLDISRKNKNQFVYTSCRERGLDKILKLWPTIKEKMPDATLMVASYNDTADSSPHDPSIHYLGKLGRPELYDVMSKSDFWFYPTDWPETSCITAMEMLACGVVCVYYPVAGLPDTIGDYGIQVKDGEEIEQMMGLTEEEKRDIQRRGRKYGLEECGWDTRAKLWNPIIFVRNYT